jgi:pimeloyl-ACP methyl ester carboxylesterase
MRLPRCLRAAPNYRPEARPYGRRRGRNGHGVDMGAEPGRMMSTTKDETRHTLEHEGCSLSYVVRGDGIPIVFIQGVGVQGDGWLPQVDVLRGQARCLTFDNRGLGRSQPVGAAMSVARMADDALALMRAVGWESAHLVGHSLGGPVALEIALSARERVRSLSLLCTFARGRDAARSRRMMWLGARSRIGTRRMRRRAFLEIVMPPGDVGAEDAEAVAERLGALFGHDLADQPPIVSRQLAAMRAYDATSRLHVLGGIPTLVVSAAHDPIAPPALGRALAAALPGANYTELADASHGVTIHRPEQVNELLRNHLLAADRLWVGDGGVHA